MKFSFRNKNEVEQKLSITIPAKEIESEVTSKLNSAKKSAKIKGFRKGKAPLDVVTKIYEPEIRREVINDAVSKNFFDPSDLFAFPNILLYDPSNLLFGIP